MTQQHSIEVSSHNGRKAASVLTNDNNASGNNDNDNANNMDDNATSTNDNINQHKL